MSSHLHNAASKGAIVAAAAAVFLAGCVLVVQSRIESTVDRLTEDQEQMEDTQVVTVRMPGRQEFSVRVLDGMTMADVAQQIEALKQQAGFKDCWVSGGTEYEVCTPVSEGQEAHDAAVAALQAIYPNEGDCD